MDLHTTYSRWKRFPGDIAQNWEGLHEPPLGVERTNDMITKEKESEGTTVRIRK